jgi:hypothetical protein
VLDQYIGVHVPPALPQFKWLPGLLVTGAAAWAYCWLFLGNTFRSRAMALLSCGLALALAVAAIQAMGRLHDIRA